MRTQAELGSCMVSTMTQVIFRSNEAHRQELSPQLYLGAQEGFAEEGALELGLDDWEGVPGKCVGPSRVEPGDPVKSTRSIPLLIATLPPQQNLLQPPGLPIVPCLLDIPFQIVPFIWITFEAYWASSLPLFKVTPEKHCLLAVNGLSDPTLVGG